jgi:hypothetical protein
MCINIEQGRVEIYSVEDSSPDYSESFWTPDELIYFIVALIEAGQKAFGEDWPKSVAALEKDA